MVAPQPGPAIIEAFGGDPASAELMTKGDPAVWWAGPVVLKPVGDPARHAWLGGLLRDVPDAPGFRLSRPVPTVTGEWVLAGWTASQWLSGFHRKGQWDRTLAASDVLHRVLASTLPAPAALPAIPPSSSPWAVGDAAAWGEIPLPEPVAEVIPDLAARVADVLVRPWAGALPQLIHGDLGGNVLFEDDPAVPVGVIDFSPYVRPADFAGAVVVADAVAWEGAPLNLSIGFATSRPHGDELLARAVVYRLVATARLFDGNPVRLQADAAAYSPLLDTLHL